jgi:hypothetical protein
MSIKCLNYTVAWQLICKLTILGMCVQVRACVNLCIRWSLHYTRVYIAFYRVYVLFRTLLHCTVQCLSVAFPCCTACSGPDTQATVRQKGHSVSWDK